MFAGHEYFDKEDFIYTFSKVASKSFTYIFHPYNFKKNYFDNKNFFAFCYSEEIKELYSYINPIKQVLFHSGVDEIPYLTLNSKNYLVWMGRIEEVKLPHLAILASKILDMPIYILGKPVYENNYYSKIKKFLSEKNVNFLGMVFGKEKLKIISEAACAIYTVHKDFIDAGPGVLAEYLCSGVPIVGITWKNNDAICEAVDNPHLGKIIKVHDNMKDYDIAEKMARAIKECLKLDRKRIYKIANKKYDMKKIMRTIFKIMNI